ncbi:uncharacterized protein gprin3a [Leuresthes tenuis]|uniref:uncharacterized protein gprin3a n=1 Tax=Leuresthes tenuis TaxID=355514 RepID=UPI003B506266
METHPVSPSHMTCLTLGLTFDSITKTSAKTDTVDEKEQLKGPKSKVTTFGGSVLSHGDVTDNTGWSPGDNKRISGTMLSKLGHLGETNTITAGSNNPSSRATGAQIEKEEKKQEYRKQNDGLGSSLTPPHHLLYPCTHTPTSKRVKETATMTDLSEIPHPHAGEQREQREVGVQVEVEVVERSVSTSPSLHWGAPTSSLTSIPSCQSSSLTSPTVPSLCCIPSFQPPLKHICKIDIELRSRALLPSSVADKASSLPTCLRTFSFQQNPTLMSEFGQNHSKDFSTQSIWEDEKEEERLDEHQEEEQDKDREETEKPQEVLWDEQGMTWEVYGASVDLESLGTAIQSHLESKIREQEQHIRTLRKSICSESSFRGYQMRKRKNKTGRILGCCGKASTVTD